MNDWFETLDGLLGQMWQRLGRGVADRRAPARHPTFATVTPDGWPQARTVVLRAARSEAAEIEVYTDIHSTKVAELRSNPRAALHIWEPAAHLQIRLNVTVRIQTGADVQTKWEAVPDLARQSYGVTPAPGTVIAQSLDYTKSPNASTFAVLSCQIQTVDLVHLGDVHRRAGFNRNDGFAGCWLVP